MTEVRYFHYRRGGWCFCVLAVSKQDADARKNLSAPTAEYLGEWTPPTWHSKTVTMETGMISTKAQEIMSGDAK
jgi:hypothetical protein